jgi:hypothetical protein
MNFELAKLLKAAGFRQPTGNEARYFINEFLIIRREEAVRMFYADKARQGWPVNIEEDLVYYPTLTELIDGCGQPFELSSPAPGEWYAKNKLLDIVEGAKGQSPTEAVARLWLALQKNL